MKKNNNPKTAKSSKSIAPSSLHKKGYRPSGAETSSGCKPPNVGTSVNKHKK